jgi:para-nitrobenzyl esterase
LAEGLFHKAIGESGARLDPRMTLADASSNGSDLAAVLNAESLSELRAMPAQQLLQGAVENRFRTDGIVDGWSIPDQPYVIFSSGQQNKVPVLVGFNAEEGTTLGALGRIPENDDVYISRIQNLYGELAADYLALYPADNLRKSTLDPARDSGFGWNSITWVRTTANVDEEAYLYYFSHRPPGPQKNILGAYHAAEIAYVFNNTQTLRNPATEEDRQMADIMSDFWLNFAKTGNPNGAGLPQWQPYTRTNPNYVELNVTARPETDLTPATWDFFDKVQANRRAAN